MRVLLLSILTLILSFSISRTTCDPILNDFVHCLANHSQYSTSPIPEAIFTYQNNSFQSALLAYIRNRRYSTPTTPKPLAIVAAKHESHVQSTVICARQHGFQIRTRSGGHDFEGLSYVSSITPFVMLDMSNLRSVDINLTDESAWVESGATLGELYFNIGNKSNVHGFPAGVCHTVGIGGHLSGGGYGPLMRKYGLTVDNVVDAKLVDVNGMIIDRKLMGEDHFWAIRGGGGASFGVILAWKIKLVHVPARVTVFNVKRNLEQGAMDIVYRWQSVAPQLPKRIFVRAMLQVQKNSTSGKLAIEVSFICHYLGGSKKLLSLINHRFPELDLQKNDCSEMSWVESTVFWGNHPVGTPIGVLLDRPMGPPDFFKSKSDYVKEPIPKHGIESILDLMLKSGLDKLYMEWNPYGGRMSEISESETPFPHRDGNLFLIQYLGYWKEDKVETARRYLDLISKMYQEMTPFVSKNPREAFLNYRDLDLGANTGNSQTKVETARVYGSMYFKDNFDRVVRVKTEVDPHNFFKNEQSIPPLSRG
ncbi:berberine bridge enzyme-like 4 [Argentina anserina]|uniref:berberine bridge enzyme-like 4 n=1 Tax=Argentina anserina TaxID=57926 RepID=UPI0021762045|nr:berberine bridge enzyme-like 4 [Potentilla anserina]